MDPGPQLVGWPIGPPFLFASWEGAEASFPFPHLPKEKVPWAGFFTSGGGAPCLGSQERRTTRTPPNPVPLCLQ